MSEFKLEIFNGTYRLFEKNILTNEFRSRENNGNINNQIILKDINENIYTKNPLDLNIENNKIEEKNILNYQLLIMLIILIKIM